MLTITILHNQDFSDAASDATVEDDDPPEPKVCAGELARADVAKVAASIASALASFPGLQIRTRPVKTIADIIRETREHRPAAVINLCESLKGDARFEVPVAWILEHLKIPFTGSPAQTLRLCLDKAACTQALGRVGVPTPRSILCADLKTLPADLTFPCIVKPNREDGSIGIEPSSVVHDRHALSDKVDHVLKTWRQAALIQQFVGTREINVGLLGAPDLDALPLMEINFKGLPPGSPHIVSYASKWLADTAEYQNTFAEPAELHPLFAQRVARIARAAARALGVRDYGRVDLRLDDQGRAWVVDVNPNCDLAPDAGFARAASRANLSYDGLCWRLLQIALTRKPAPCLLGPGPGNIALHRARWNNSASTDAERLS